ncbi:hypothetical protein BKA69DRAFT_1061808 [Paraphysoderma sedebokerense]|nr:hypothetical protein BKA69DRAFT_1061808 [Paraphysoderma sedebokerense]
MMYSCTILSKCVHHTEQCQQLSLGRCVGSASFAIMEREQFVSCPRMCCIQPSSPSRSSMTGPPPSVPDSTYDLFRFLSSIQSHLRPNSLPHFIDLLKLHLTTQDDSLVSFEDLCSLANDQDGRDILKAWLGHLEELAAQDMLEGKIIEPDMGSQELLQEEMELEMQEDEESSSERYFSSVCYANEFTPLWNDEPEDTLMDQKLQNLNIADGSEENAPTLPIHQYLESDGHVVGTSRSGFGEETSTGSRRRGSSSSIIILAHLSKLSSHLERVHEYLYSIFELDDADYWFKRYLSALRLDDENATHEDVLSDLDSVIAEVELSVGKWLKCFLIEEEVAAMLGTLILPNSDMSDQDDKDGPSESYLSFLAGLRETLSKNISTQEVIGSALSLLEERVEIETKEIENVLRSCLCGSGYEVFGDSHDSGEAERGGIFHVLHAPIPSIIESVPAQLTRPM